MAITANQQPIKEKGTFWPAFWARVWIIVQAIGHSLFTWSWCKSLLYWLIISGGTMAELAFLIGAVWMSLNATVHPFILMFISEGQTRYLSFLATSAYVALPELIVSLAVIVTIEHIGMFVYRRHWTEIIWIVLYGLPAAFFAGLSAYTIGESVASVDFTMPKPFIVARALGGFLFAFTSLLYWKLGTPQEAARLRKKDEERHALAQEKDSKISEQETEINRLNILLRSETARLTSLLQSETSRLTALIEEQRGELHRTKRQQEELISVVSRSEDAALEAYGEECISWLRSGIKTVNVDEISRHTGHSKRKVNNAIEAGKLQTSPRNRELVLVSSLTEWLKQNQPVNSRGEQETGPMLHTVSA